MPVAHNAFLDSEQQWAQLKPWLANGISNELGPERINCGSALAYLPALSSPDQIALGGEVNLSNPVSKSLDIVWRELRQDQYDAYLIDQFGLRSSLFSFESSAGSRYIDVEHLSQGVYLLQISGKKNQSNYFRKIVKL
jgi:hypothetical protein